MVRAACAADSAGASCGKRSLAIDELFDGLNAALSDAKLPLANRLRKFWAMHSAFGLDPALRRSRRDDGIFDDVVADLLDNPAMELGEPGRAWLPTIAVGFAEFDLTTARQRSAKARGCRSSPPSFAWHRIAVCSDFPLASRWAILEALDQPSPKTPPTTTCR